MINTAIIGLGRWGQRLVSSVQGVSDTIQFTAGVKLTPAEAEVFAASHKLKLHTDYRRVLDDPSIDAIVVASPHSHHAEHVIAASDAGKPVYVEKPFTLTKESAVAAVAACKRNGVVLAFGHNRRFLPAMEELKRLIESGELGALLHVEGNFSDRYGFLYQPDSWKANRTELPAGGMTGLGIHIVDSLIHLGGGIRDIHAYSQRLALAIDIDDTTVIHLRFRGGHFGYFATIMATAPVWRLQIFGTKGWAEMRGHETLIVAPLEGEPAELMFPQIDTERAELEAFAEAVTGGTPYPVSADDAIHGVAVLEAIVASAKSGWSETIE